MHAKMLNERLKLKDKIPNSQSFYDYIKQLMVVHDNSLIIYYLIKEEGRRAADYTKYFIEPILIVKSWLDCKML